MTHVPGVASWLFVYTCVNSMRYSMKEVHVYTTFGAVVVSR